MLEFKEQQCGFAVARKKRRIDRCVVVRGKESHGALREGVRMDRGWRVGQFNDPSKSTGLADGESWKRAVPRGWLAWASSFIDGRAGRAGSPCQPALACTSSMLSDGKLPLGTENAPRTSKLRLRLRMSLRSHTPQVHNTHPTMSVREATIICDGPSRSSRAANSLLPNLSDTDHDDHDDDDDNRPNSNYILDAISSIHAASNRY